MTVVEELRVLRARRGWPSCRIIAENCDVSHTTVADVLNGRVRTWNAVSAVVIALEGDEDGFYDMWTNERRGGEIKRRPEVEDELANILRRYGWTCVPPEEL